MTLLELQLGEENSKYVRAILEVVLLLINDNDATQLGARPKHALMLHTPNSSAVEKEDPKHSFDIDEFAKAFVTK